MHNRSLLEEHPVDADAPREDLSSNRQVMRFFVWLRSILLGWAALLVIGFAVENTLLHWTGPLFGARWIATAHLAFDCLTLAAAGWVVGRFNRPHSIAGGLVFAVTLSFWDFGALNVPLLLRLVWNSFQDSRFVDALLTSVETHALLFGCLIAGAALSRPRARPISIATPR
jgi:hypothetical protein